MKKGLKIGAMSLAALLVFGVAGCGKVSDKDGKAWAEANGYVKSENAAALPSPVDTSIAKCDTDDTKTRYGADCSAINKDNLEDYLGRSDVFYVDVRNSTAVGTFYRKSATGTFKKVVVNNKDTYVAIEQGEEVAATERYESYQQLDPATYSGAHLKGFANVEFFAYVFDSSANHSGKQLFYKGEDGRFVPRYATSVETLEALFPKNKTLFIMCQSGGRVVTLMQLLDQFGWDMEKVYNVGGMSSYTNEEFAVILGDDYAYTEKVGTATGEASGTALNVTVRVLYDDVEDKVGAVTIVSGTTSSASYAEAWKAELPTLLDSFVGLSADEVSALVSNGQLSDDVDVIAGATVSTKLIVDAVINALA